MPEITWEQQDGYVHSDQVSDLLRESLRPKGKFRQFAMIPEESFGAKKNKGDTFYWDVVSAPARQNFRLAETDRIRSSAVTVTQNSVVVTEMGHAIEHTSKAELLSHPQWEALVESGLSFMAASQFDVESFLQFKETPLVVAPTGGNNVSSITAVTNGTPTITNNTPLTLDHVKAIGDLMKKRHIPPDMTRDSYMAIMGIDTIRPIKNELETIHQYTETGLSHIKFGEVGRYEDFIFVEQTMIPAGGAEDSTTYNPYTDTADAWNNAQSDWAFFFGGDPVTEAVIIPEEIRAKLPEDYGRDKGAAWYYLGAFGITHPDATNSRIVMWGSAA